jgi:hypothetical protein
VTVTNAIPNADGSALLVAVIVAWVVDCEFGAVYRPCTSTDPEEADQATAVFEVPATLAVNCCVPAGAKFTLAGETLTLIPPAPPIVTEYGCFPMSGFGLSVTCTSNEYCPGVVGCPLNDPVEAFSVRPGGRVPETTENWYGETPPFTERTAL